MLHEMSGPPFDENRVFPHIAMASLLPRPPSVNQRSELQSKENNMTTAPGVPFPRLSRISASHAVAHNTMAPEDTSADDDGLAAFLSVRRRLFGIAYRMLG